MLQVSGVLIIVLCISSVCSQLDSRWKLIWSDEFNGDQINTDYWNVANEAGLSSNGEKEWYLPDHVYLSNGSLILESTNQSFVTSFPYRSGRVDTNGKFASTYGRYEVRARLPQGKGMWPAHWLLSKYLCWPIGTEFDIMEALGNNINNIYGTVHFSEVCYQGNQNGSVYKAPFDYSSDFHIYAIEWNVTSVKWFVDSEQYYEIDTNTVDNGKPQSLDNSPHYWILNTAVGGYWPGDPDSTTLFPQYHYIDYVRTYGWQPCETGCNNGCCYSPLEICICDEGYEGTFCEYIANGVVPGNKANCSIAPTPPPTPAPTNPPTPPPCVVPPSGSQFIRDFSAEGYNSTIETFGKAVQGPTLEIPDNAVIENGQLVLTTTTNQCPNSCGGYNYSGAVYSTNENFPSGTFSFKLKSSAVSGTAMIFWVTGEESNGVYDAVQFTLPGNAPSNIVLQYWDASGSMYLGEFNLGFDSSADFHEYSFRYYPDSITSFYIDGNLFCTIPPGGSANLNFKIEYFAQPQYYGTYTSTTPSSVYVDSIQWQSNCNER